MRYFVIVFISSCYAACHCPASNQTCTDSCVTTANACVAQCRENRMDSFCEQSCLLNNWPSVTHSTSAIASSTNVPLETATFVSAQTSLQPSASPTFTSTASSLFSLSVLNIFCFLLSLLLCA
ncbi:hypothetical protein BY458DRAFT_296853 [Sporodiniella umbellata]|nr:hypothetical protein BY458DRAFT_296853 [Sporodiniella umbellata]